MTPGVFGGYLLLDICTMLIFGILLVYEGGGGAFMKLQGFNVILSQRKPKEAKK